MRALPADIGKRRRAVAVDLDPEHVEIGNRPQDLQIPLGLRIEVQIEQQIDIRPGAVANGFEMGAQIAQDILVDVEFGNKRDAKSGTPAAWRTSVIDKDVGLQSREASLANLRADCLDAVEAGD